MRAKIAASLLVLGFAVPVAAQNGGEAPIPPKAYRLAPGDGEPEVRIIQRKDVTVHEYRSAGRVYMVRIDPAYGPPYYLFDRNGDGNWDERFGPHTATPQWTIWRW